MSKYILTFYELEYSIIKQFDSYKEAAAYFNSTTKSLQCYICRQKKKPDKKKRYKNIWGYLVKDDIEE